VGTSLLANLVDKVTEGKGSPMELEEILKISHIMKTMAHCGLGQTAPNHLLDSLLKFRPVWDARMMTTEFEPAFDLDGALEEARQLTGRADLAAHL
jgi:[NiFe] hydrogenase diaphorase moiety large subunit